MNKQQQQNNVSVIPNGKRLETLTSSYTTREKCPLSPVLSNIVSLIFTRANEPEKVISGIQIKKKKKIILSLSLPM